MGLLKLGRNYTLSVKVGDNQTLTIDPPISIEFDITRNILTSANVCQIKIYNLSENNRALLRYDYTNYGILRPLQLRAGYGNNLPLIFNGNISQCFSTREGVDFITTIECYDGGFAFVNGHTNRSFIAGTTVEKVYRDLISDLPGIAFGAISDNYIKDEDGKLFTLSKGIPHSGSTINILKKLTNGGFFIDNGKAYILGPEYAFNGDITVIDASTGLLGTPTRENTVMSFDMIFEPRLQIGQQINVQSSTIGTTGAKNKNGATGGFGALLGGDPGENLNNNLNGVYKVISVKHRGMISPSVSGNVITSASFYFSPLHIKILGVM